MKNSTILTLQVPSLIRPRTGKNAPVSQKPVKMTVAHWMAHINAPDRQSQTIWPQNGSTHRKAPATKLQVVL